MLYAHRATSAVVIQKSVTRLLLCAREIMSIFIIYYCNNIVVWRYLIKIKTAANKSPRRVGGGEGNRYNRLLLFFLSIHYYGVGANRFIEMTKNIIVSSSLTINGPPPPRTPIYTVTAAAATVLCTRRRRWFMCCSQRTLKPVCAFIYNDNNIHLYYNLIATYIYIFR